MTNARLILQLLCICWFPVAASAQVNAVKWTADEQKELFGFCEKQALIREFKISDDKADKIGQILYWSTIQKQKVEANATDTFATAREVDQEATKKFKAISLSGDQIQILLEKGDPSNWTSGCQVMTLKYNPAYDSMQKPQMVLLFKSKYRKMMLDKIGINGRQADMLIDAEVWRQKESQQISKIPTTDFNRIRKTVEMNNEMERKLKHADMSDTQLDAARTFLDLTFQ